MIFSTKEPISEAAAAFGIAIWLSSQFSTVILYDLSRRIKYESRNYYPCVFQVFEDNTNISDLPKNGIVFGLLPQHQEAASASYDDDSDSMGQGVRVGLLLISNCPFFNLTLRVAIVTAGCDRSTETITKQTQSEIPFFLWPLKPSHWIVMFSVSKD